MLNPGAQCPAAKAEEHSILNQDYAKSVTEKFKVNTFKV
jgi:hypothetical protein